jgi:tetratricopeptide (TPR) repeat protein
VVSPSLDDAESYFSQGRFQHQKGNLEAAIALYTEALTMATDHLLAYTSRAGAYGALADYEAAIADYTAALELDPELAAAYGGRGVARYYLADIEGSVTDLWQAAQLYRAQGDDASYFTTLDILSGVAP